MLRTSLSGCVLLSALLACRSVCGGPFAPQAGQPGSTAIAAGDPRFIEWASSIASITRGPQNITNPSLGLASFGSPANALGPSNSTVVSLGDGGQITLGFAQPIRNGAGPDFAVFENGFISGSLAFLELGFVEVSSDGADFFRFPAVSATQTATQVGSFGLLDATNLDNLAGKYVAGFGTPFDLDQLAGISPLLDVNNVSFVRIVDVVGSIDPLYATHDSMGAVVNDPWPTASASSGFDLDAVGVINAVPEPAGWALAAIGVGLFAIACKRKRKSRR